MPWPPVFGNFLRVVLHATQKAVPSISLPVCVPGVFCVAPSPLLPRARELLTARDPALGFSNTTTSPLVVKTAGQQAPCRGDFMLHVHSTAPPWRMTYLASRQGDGSDPGSNSFPLETCAELEQLLSLMLAPHQATLVQG